MFCLPSGPQTPVSLTVGGVKERHRHLLRNSLLLLYGARALPSTATTALFTVTITVKVKVPDTVPTSFVVVVVVTFTVNGHGPDLGTDLVHSHGPCHGHTNVRVRSQSLRRTVVTSDPDSEVKQNDTHQFSRGVVTHDPRTEKFSAPHLTPIPLGRRVP